MIELLIATALTCSEAQELIEKVSVSQGIDRDSVIEVINMFEEISGKKNLHNFFLESSKVGARKITFNVFLMGANFDVVPEIGLP